MAMTATTTTTTTTTTNTTTTTTTTTNATTTTTTTKKLGFRPRDPHGEIRAGILCRIPVLKSQMVGWRPIWWQKGVIWGPLGFRAQPAHPAGGRAAGGRAVAPTLIPLVSTHPPKIAIPLPGGITYVAPAPQLVQSRLSTRVQLVHWQAVLA